MSRAPDPPARRRALGVLAVVAALGCALLAGAPSPVSAARLGTQRPSAPVSSDGLQAGDGQRTLRVGQAHGLDPRGQQVGVAGSGYDVDKGVYVGLCVVTPADQPPSPCGGGIDRTGATGASAWISSNAPSYAGNLPTPYGPGGSFSVNVTVAPVVAEGFDCRRIQCAIVTRNDHTRTADRTQDIFIPVTFGAEPPPDTAPETTAPPTSAPPTTIAPPPPPTTTAPAPAPDAELSADGLTATEGGRSLTVSAADDLDPEGTTLTVAGEGFDPAKGIQVTLCRVVDDPTQPAAPCLAGTAGASRVVLPADQDDEGSVFTPFGAGGTFEVEIDVAAEIDDATDCREAPCAVVARHFELGDDRAEAAAADRTLDLAVPVAFADASPEPGPGTDEQAAAPDGAAADGSGGSPWPWVAVGAAALAAAVGAVLWRARRGTTGGDAPQAAPSGSRG